MVMENAPNAPLTAVCSTNVTVLSDGLETLNEPLTPVILSSTTVPVSVPLIVARDTTGVEIVPGVVIVSVRTLLNDVVGREVGAAVLPDTGVEVTRCRSAVLVLFRSDWISASRRPPIALTSVEAGVVAVVVSSGSGSVRNFVYGRA